MLKIDIQNGTPQQMGRQALWTAPSVLVSEEHDFFRMKKWLDPDPCSTFQTGSHTRIDRTLCDGDAHALENASFCNPNTFPTALEF